MTYPNATPVSGSANASDPPAPAWPNTLAGFAAPKVAPSMNPRPKALSTINTVSGPRTCSAVVCATVASFSVRMPSTPAPNNEAYRRARARASLMPFEEGISHVCICRVFHMSS